MFSFPVFAHTHVCSLSSTCTALSGSFSVSSNHHCHCPGKWSYSLIVLVTDVFFLCSELNASPNENQLSSSFGSSYGSYGSLPGSLPTFQHPSHSLLKENGFTQQVYHKYRARCLKGMLQFSCRGCTQKHLSRKLKPLIDSFKEGSVNLF